MDELKKEIEMNNEIIEKCLTGVSEMSTVDQMKLALAVDEFASKLKPLYTKYFIGEKSDFLMKL